MAKFDNEWYNKGYEDGISDAQNNIDIDDITLAVKNRQCLWCSR